MDDVTRLLTEMVAIPSVNPMGRALPASDTLERGMSDYLERWFRALGVRHERRTIAPGRDNVLAWYDAPHSRTTLLFDAHQDTVPVDGMTIPPFEPSIEGDRLYGRGACDIKGGMAAMLSAFARLVRDRPSGSASVIMACTVDEEFTHTGSSRLGADLQSGAVRRSRDRHGADPAGGGSLPQGGRALEGPDPRGRLPQFDAPTRHQRDLPDGAGDRRLAEYAEDSRKIPLIRSWALPACRSDGSRGGSA